MWQRTVQTDIGAGIGANDGIHADYYLIIYFSIVHT